MNSDIAGQAWRREKNFLWLTEMRAACSLPLIAQPSAGLPGRRMDVEAFAALTAELLRAGASHAGGCCGTTSEYIRRIAPMVHKGDGI